MKIDPALRALRGDPAAQRHAQDALETAREAWRRQPAVAAVLAELVRWGQGGALEAFPALAGLMARANEADSLLAPLVSGQLAALAGQPLGQIPFRHQVSEGIAILQLAVAGAATLSLLVYEQHAGTGQEEAICFSDGERHELVLAGSATAEVLECGGDRLRGHMRLLARGDCLSLAGPDIAKRLTRIEGRLVVLRLSRSPERPAPSRQFDLASGQLVHVASGDRRESRHELALAVLGRMGRREAAPLLAEMTGEDASDHLRWQALRECLALDTAQGFAALTRLARDPGDTLAVPAGALRARLLEAHRELAQLTEAGAMPCPVP